MCYWNWFAVHALRVPQLRFLETLGLTWLVQMLVEQPDTDSQVTERFLVFWLRPLGEGIGKCGVEGAIERLRPPRHDRVASKLVLD
jgi:hypothetical protein